MMDSQISTLKEFSLTGETLFYCFHSEDPCLQLVKLYLLYVHLFLQNIPSIYMFQLQNHIYFKSQPSSKA